MKACNPIYGHHVISDAAASCISSSDTDGCETWTTIAMTRWSNAVLGLKRLPDVSTVSRSLSGADEQSVGKVRASRATVVMERLVADEIRER